MLSQLASCCHMWYILRRMVSVTLKLLPFLFSCLLPFNFTKCQLQLLYPLGPRDHLRCMRFGGGILLKKTTWWPAILGHCLLHMWQIAANSAHLAESLSLMLGRMWGIFFLLTAYAHCVAGASPGCKLSLNSCIQWGDVQPGCFLINKSPAAWECK